jgi:hypothetical protein
MRTTIRLNDDLLTRAKEEAIKTGRTLTAVIEDSLRQTLASKTVKRKRRRTRLPSSGKGWLQPGVDLDRTADLLDIMDERRR